MNKNMLLISVTLKKIALRNMLIAIKKRQWKKMKFWFAEFDKLHK